MRKAAVSALVLLLVGEAVAGTITRAGSLAVARSGASATLLADGRVLVAGGSRDERRLEIFDPKSGLSTLTEAETMLPLLAHTATALRDGRVLLVGGGFFAGFVETYGSIVSEAYEAAAQTLRSTGQLSESRKGHTATLLADGRVLISGGESGGFGPLYYRHDLRDSAEIFDPLTNSFTPAGRMHRTRTEHTATLLPDGRVLLAGGGDATLEIYDPLRQSFTLAGEMLAPRSQHTATLLPDGRVLFAGGKEDAEGTAEIFDPATGATTIAGNIGVRRQHTATLLPGGHVLIAGGGVADAIVFDPLTGAVVERLPLPNAFGAHTALPLPDGSVLLVGAEVLRYQASPPTPRRRAARR